MLNGRIEEKKLTDDTEIDVGMIEKSVLFDQEQNKEQYVWLLKGSIWKTYKLSKLLDLIYRLQNDYSNLKERYVKVLGLNEKVIAEQKAKIERLARESDEMFDRHAKENQAASLLIEKRNDEIAELQKQVDELKEENGKLVTIGNGFALERNNLREELDELKKSGNGVLLTSLYKKQADDHKRGLSVQRAYWKKKLQQSVKDTAKEIWNDCIDKIMRGCGDDKEFWVIEILIETFKKFGVGFEVE